MTIWKALLLSLQNAERVCETAGGSDVETCECGMGVLAESKPVMRHIVMHGSRADLEMMKSP